jgi:hypothetical protein
LYQTLFLTDGEFQGVVKQEPLDATRALTEDVGVQQGCLACGGKCCRDLGCGFFSEAFSSCPIFEYRPAKCRFHFCSDLLASDTLDKRTEELLNLGFKNLSEVIGKEHLAQVFGGPWNPSAEGRGLTGLDLELEASAIVSSLEKGELDASAAQGRLSVLVRKHREVSARA